MSLINEALKRAKEAQGKAPAPDWAGAPLRPADTAHTVQRTAGLLLPVVLTGVALAGLFFLWRGTQLNLPVRARIAAPQPTISEAAKPAAAPVTPPPASAPIAAPPAGAMPIATTPEPAKPGDAPASPPAASTATNLVTLVASPAPKPAPLRLQAIVFSPVRPSAMISGKTLFVGDRLGEFRVLAIRQESVTLASSTITNVLRLPE